MVGHICLIHIVENALVLLVLSLGDLDLGNSLLRLFFHGLDGTVKMLDLRQGLGAT